MSGSTGRVLAWRLLRGAAVLGKLLREVERGGGLHAVRHQRVRLPLDQQRHLPHGRPW